MAQGYEVKIKIESSGASANGYEIANILRKIADRVDWGDGYDQSLFDINGNKIGHATIKFI